MVRVKWIMGAGEKGRSEGQGRWPGRRWGGSSDGLACVEKPEGALMIAMLQSKAAILCKCAQCHSSMHIIHAASLVGMQPLEP